MFEPTQLAIPAAQRRTAAWTMSVPTNALWGEAEHGDEDDRDQGPAAGRGEADDEAGDGPVMTAIDLVLAVQVHRGAVGDDVAKEERPDERRHADDQKSGAHHASAILLTASSP